MQFEIHQIELERVEPFSGESISHFLGRFERANVWTTYQIGRASEIPGRVSRWKKLFLNPAPTFEELEALSEVVEVSADRLAGMLPSTGQAMKPPRPIWLCAACYSETPCHLIKWQFKGVTACDRHKLRLLEKCPKCKKLFEIPALWENGVCSRCSTPFSAMIRSQGASSKR